MSEAPRRCVLVFENDYKELLRRAICAPKNLPTLTGKQRNKVDDAMREACIVMMQRKDAHLHGEAVEQKMEQTLTN